MKCEGEKRYLNSLRTLDEVREARRELALREFFAREKLTQEARGLFSWGGLLSMLIPRGSMVDRLLGGVIRSI